MILRWVGEMQDNSVCSHDCSNSACICDEVLVFARQELDMTPSVECSGDGIVTVRVVTFSEFSGFTVRTYTIARDGFVNDSRILDEEKENVIYYWSVLVY